MTGPEKLVLQRQLEERFGSNEELGYLPSNFIEIVNGLPRLIDRRVISYYPELQNREYLIRELSVPHSSYPIFAFQVVAGAFSRNIYVKFAPIYPQKNEGLVEYENLCLIDEQFPKGQEYGSPKPLEFIADLNALVMEGVEGIAFRKILLRNNWLGAWPAPRSVLKAIVQRCGRWLRDFHRINGIECTSIETPLKSSMLLTWQRIKPGFSDSQLALQVQKIIESRPAVSVMPGSRKHGDLALDNILVDKKSINVLDVSYTDRDVIYRDVAFFVANLRTINNLPFHLFFDFGYARQLCGDFLSAYGISEFLDGNATLQFYVIEAILGRFESQANTIKAKLGSASGDFLVRYLCRKYSRILGEVVEDYS